MENKTVTIRGKKYPVDLDISDLYYTISYRYVEGGYKQDISDRVFARAIQVMIPSIPASLVSEQKLVLTVKELGQLIRDLYRCYEPLLTGQASQESEEELQDFPAEQTVLSTPEDAANIGKPDDDELARLRAELQQLKSE